MKQVRAIVHCTLFIFSWHRLLAGRVYCLYRLPVAPPNRELLIINFAAFIVFALFFVAFHLKYEHLSKWNFTLSTSKCSPAPSCAWCTGEWRVFRRENNYELCVCGKCRKKIIMNRVAFHSKQLFRSFIRFCVCVVSALCRREFDG